MVGPPIPGGGGGKGNPKPGGRLLKEALPEGSAAGGEGLVGCCADGFELPNMLEKEKGEEEEPVIGLSSMVLEDVDDAGTVGLQEGAGWPTFRASSGSMAMNRSLDDEGIVLLSIADSMMPLASSS